jgi:hypothetical protein
MDYWTSMRNLRQELMHDFSKQGVDPSLIKGTLDRLFPMKQDKPSSLELKQARIYLMDEYVDAMLHMKPGPARTAKMKAISQKWKAWK